eukprot:6113062-Alexandrium_andersonii.AAC.1
MAKGLSGALCAGNRCTRLHPGTSRRLCRSRSELGSLRMVCLIKCECKQARSQPPASVQGPQHSAASASNLDIK